MKAPVRYGLIYGGIGIGISLLTYGLGIEKDDSVQSIIRWVNIALPAVMIFLGIRARRDEEGNGFISFGSGFSAGMIIASISAVITGIYTYLYMTVLNPGIVTYIKMKQEEELVKRGLSDSEIEQVSGNMDMWTSPGMMTLYTVVGILLLGLVISLISSAILKKENPQDII